MLISSKEAIVLVDNTPIINGFRLNIDPKSHQIRLKTSVFDNESLIPIDIVVTNYSNIISNLSTISLNVTGIELNTHINFNIKISINLLKKTISGIIGKIGKTHIDYHIDGDRFDLNGLTVKKEDLTSKLLVDQLKEIITKNH